MNNNINTRNNVVQGLEGYLFLGSGIWPNTVRMGKCKISWPETEFDCYARSGIYKNIIWAWDVGVFCQSIRNSGAREVNRKIQKERGRRNPLHSPSSFLPLFPLCLNILRYQKGCLIFAIFLNWHALIQYVSDKG